MPTHQIKKEYNYTDRIKSDVYLFILAFMQYLLQMKDYITALHYFKHFPLITFQIHTVNHTVVNWIVLYHREVKYAFSTRLMVLK